MSAERERLSLISEALNFAEAVREAVEVPPTYRDFSGTDESTCAWCNEPLEGYEGRIKGKHARGCRWTAAAQANRLLVETLDDLLAALRSSEPQGWQPIESAPKDGTNVLGWIVFRGGKGIAEIMYWPTHWLEADREWAYALDAVDGVPTHWQPLPAAPFESVRDTEGP